MSRIRFIPSAYLLQDSDAGVDNGRIGLGIEVQNVSNAGLACDIMNQVQGPIDLLQLLMLITTSILSHRAIPVHAGNAPPPTPPPKVPQMRPQTRGGRAVNPVVVSPVDGAEAPPDVQKAMEVLQAYLAAEVAKQATPTAPEDTAPADGETRAEAETDPTPAPPAVEAEGPAAADPSEAAHEEPPNHGV